jgi:capsular polysaccharide biosynthesis protein
VTSYSAPLKRFRLVIAVGLVVGAAVALTSAYKVDLGTLPPKLTAREQPTYTAGTQLEVSSPVQPYYRSAVDVPVVAPSAGDEEDEPTNLVEQAEPSVQTLIAAANYYPYVIEGDAVRALRERLFGEIEGEISATAIGATITPSRHEPGRLPFIQVIATSDSPQRAIDLAQHTAEAFIRHVQVQQRETGIRPEQRLVVKQLRRPERTFAAGGTSPTLPVLVFFAFVAASVGIAFVLDRMRPVPAPAVVAADDAARRGRDEPLIAAAGSPDA